MKLKSTYASCCRPSLTYAFIPKMFFFNFQTVTIRPTPPTPVKYNQKLNDERFEKNI